MASSVIDLPGFTRGERLFLGLAAGIILIWGFVGVDLEAGRAPVPGPGQGDRVLQSAVDPAEPHPAAGSAGAVGAARGRQVFEESGCGSCHSLDGTPAIGPDLRGIWGTRQPMQDGTGVVVDRAYFQESILRPEARLVRGYKPAMPSYEGLVTEEDLVALEEYVRTLK